MTQAYFLVPGLLLDESVHSAISEKSLALASELSSSLTGDPLMQELGTGVFSRSGHLCWLWSVLMKRTLPPQTAAYAWPVDQGPQLCSNDVFRLYPVNKSEDGVITSVTLTEEVVEIFYKLITPVFDTLGFKLQRWDKVFYLTRKDNWGVALRPFEALVGHARDLALDIEGLAEDAMQKEAQRLAAVKVFETVESVLNQAKIEVGGTSVNALWIDGASRYANVYPPTTIRSVLTDDAAVFGWGLAAGILNHRLGKTTGALDWPSDAPSGERIAVIDNLYEAWLARDWNRWQEKLPDVVEQIKLLSESARKKGCDQVLIVACGNATTVSIPKKLTHPKSLLARFSANKKLDAARWLFCGNSQTVKSED
ncbi:MAG: hypothetical protein Q4E62_05950 [Sutterellaceae bacterium]|nr:hypothetical protein [Sutterellaceae bacterium]